MRKRLVKDQTTCCYVGDEPLEYPHIKRHLGPQILGTWRDTPQSPRKTIYEPMQDISFG
jgi:hypothetical protein